MLPLFAATLFLAADSATAASDNQAQPAAASRTVPEPAAPWLALVFAAVLIAIRNRAARH